jgi:hypothetical protein
MNFSPVYLAAGLLLLLAVWFAAARSALCVLRRKNIPLDSAKEIGRILSAAFFVIYLCSAALFSLTLVPQAAGLLRGILPQTAGPAPAPPPEQEELPQGRMPAELNRAERHRLLAEAAEHEDSTPAGQEQVYVVSESIFGTKESEAQRWQRALQETASQRHEPPQAAVSPELPPPSPVRDDRVSVQELVLIAGSMPLPADVRQPQPEQPAPPAPPPVPIQQAASGEIELSGQGLRLPAAAEHPGGTAMAVFAPQPAAPPQQNPAAQTVPPPQQPSQPVPTRQRPALRHVRCEEIKIFMDDTDLAVLKAMSAKPVGGIDSWKGLRGRYTISRTGRKGGCAEYTLQADLEGAVLQCRQLCQDIVMRQQPAVSSQPQPAGKSDKSVIRDAMDDADVDKFLDILEQAESTVPRVWRNPRSGNRYTVTMLRSRGPCRDFDVQAIIQGEPFRYRESNCD